MAAGSNAEVALPMLVHSRSEYLSLTVLVGMQHVLGGHKIILWSIMWSGASSDEPGHPIILPVTRIVVLLVEGRH